MTAPFDYRQKLEVETPEHVMLDYEVAGLGSRALAAIIDTGIVVAIEVALTLGVSLVLSRLTGNLTAMTLFILASFLVLFGYFALFEGFRNGQTPGKAMMGLRVIRETGHAITFRDALVRNLIRIADFLPPPYLIGALFVALHPKARRLGDLVAGTVVIRDRPIEAGRAVLSPEARDVQSAPLGPPLLADEEFRLLRQYKARAADLPEEVRRRLAMQLIARFATRAPIFQQREEAYLSALLRDETARRQGGLAVSRHTSSEQRGSSTVVAERLVAQKSARWAEFDALLRRTRASGLDALTANELPEFASRYREVTSDLARLRTYGADSTSLARVTQLAAAGHSLLYNVERRTMGQLWHFLAVQAPASVVTARRSVFLAFLAFAVPAAAGYATLRTQPELAERVIPASMLQRADEGIERRDRGVGYAQTEGKFRALAASSITTNNIRVAFMCFAGGVFFAVGALVLLALNGLQLGAISGHFHNVGLLDYLWTFVAGHGVLELFAIWCAGAAGFILGSAVVRPGAYTRSDALAMNGRLAMHLVGMSIILLLVAGAIEGFFSTSGASASAKVAVSVASAIALITYLFVGAHGARRALASRQTERWNSE